MSVTPFPSKDFMQICWVVPDIKAAINNWLNVSGVGPFFWFDKVAFEEPVYRGQQTECADITAAMAQAGEVQIELVSQNDDRASIWRDVAPRGRSRLHHMALYCEDYDASLEAYTSAGAEVAFSGLMMGARVCWIDTTATLGFMVELIECNPIADDVFKAFRDAAKNWDGSDPIRTLG